MVHLSISCRSASLSLAAAAWKALASCCILDNWSVMAWIAAAWRSAGWRTTEGCRQGSLEAGRPGLCRGSGRFWASSGAVGLWSCWWAVFPPCLCLGNRLVLNWVGAVETEKGSFWSSGLPSRGLVDRWPGKGSLHPVVPGGSLHS